MTKRWWGWALLAGGLALAAPSVSGCSKKAKNDDTSSDEKSDKSEKKKKKVGDDDDDSPKKAKYAHGDVLKHVPKSCKGGRVYVNLGLLLKNEAVESNA